MNAPFPDALGSYRLSTGDFLLQLTVHLGYHLGQASYHRRVVTGNKEGVGALSPESLSTARISSDD
jgi:hypothetical protein